MSWVRTTYELFLTTLMTLGLFIAPVLGGFFPQGSEPSYVMPVSPIREVVFVPALDLPSTEDETEQVDQTEEETNPDLEQSSEPENVPNDDKAESIAKSVLEREPISQSLKDAEARRQERQRKAIAEYKKRRKQKRRSRSHCMDDEPGITKLTSERYSVEREVLQHYARNVKEASRLANVAWHRDDSGRVDGFEFRHIRCGSPVAQAGFRKGDVVHTINGRKIRSIPQALAAVIRLQRRSVLRVTLTRGEDKRKMRYHIA